MGERSPRDQSGRTCGEGEELVLIALLGAVVLLHNLSISAVTAGPGDEAFSFQQTARYACGGSSAGEDTWNACRAAAVSSRTMAPSGARAPAVLTETVQVLSGAGLFTGRERSRTRRCGPSLLAFLQIFRC
jgi:hypothetical protein